MGWLLLQLSCILVCAPTHCTRHFFFQGGGDLAGYPVTLASADPSLCWGLCNATAACTAWGKLQLWYVNACKISLFLSPRHLCLIPPRHPHLRFTAYAIPNCDGFASPTCWLKGSHPTKASQVCRVSGDQGKKLRVRLLLICHCG